MFVEKNGVILNRYGAIVRIPEKKGGIFMKDNRKFFWKELKSNSIPTAVLSLIYGLILIIWPDTSANTICYVVAAAIILVGIVFIIQYIRKDVMRDFYRKDLVAGLVAISLGLIALFRVDIIKGIIPTVLGFIVLFSGIVKLQNAFDMLRMKYAYWYVILILAILNLAFGAVLILEPSWIVNMVFVLIGCGLVYSGASDLLTIFFVSKTIKRLQKEQDIID